MELVSAKKGEELIKRNHVLGTPFVIITVDEGSFVGCGKYRLTEFMTEEECQELINNRDWNLIISMVSIISESINQKQ